MLIPETLAANGAIGRGSFPHASILGRVNRRSDIRLTDPIQAK
jgi:hypothetical protein